MLQMFYPFIQLFIFLLIPFFILLVICSALAHSHACLHPVYLFEYLDQLTDVKSCSPVRCKVLP